MGYDSDPEVPYYSLTCCECGAQHGAAPSVVNKWHVCKECNAAYCPDCGSDLGRTGGFVSYASGSRRCRCGGETKLV